jgi:hypothetical protein
MHKSSFPDISRVFLTRSRAGLPSTVNKATHNLPP